MSCVSQLNLDKIMARQPTQKQIPAGNLGFKSFSYNLFKKQKKNAPWITKKAYPCNDISGLAVRGKIMALMVPHGAGKSHDSFLTYNGCQNPSYVVSSLLAYILFFAIKGFNRHLWQILYSSLINTNAFMMLVISAMISRYIICYAVVIAMTILVFLKLLQVPKFLLQYVSAIKYPFEALLISSTKCVKGIQVSFSNLHNTTSAVPNWMLINEDALHMVDFYSIEGFCVSLGILLVWGVLCRLLFYVVHMLHCKNDRK